MLDCLDFVLWGETKSSVLLSKFLNSIFLFNSIEGRGRPEINDFFVVLNKKLLLLGSQFSHELLFELYISADKASLATNPRTNALLKKVFLLNGHNIFAKIAHQNNVTIEIVSWSKYEDNVEITPTKSFCAVNTGGGFSIKLNTLETSSVLLTLFVQICRF